jgi:tetratricopeptide (TPR) repeat protein
LASSESGEGRIGSLMKWVGIVGGLLSFGGAVYGVLQAQGDLRERARIVDEQYKAGEAQEKAGDYAAAWDSFAQASTVAGTDGFFAKLLGGLSDERQKVRTAQEDLAMEWLRESRAPEGHTFAEITDKLVNTLVVGANSASGARKGDLLAHLGWAYFLKQRSGDSGLQPEKVYREAIAADAANPYANAFWAHWILWNRGSLQQANEHFAAALSTGRARGVVRHFQLAALKNAGERADGEWVKVVNDMHKTGESLDATTLRDLYNHYYSAVNDDATFKRLLDAVPPTDHLALENMLLMLAPDDQLLTLNAALAQTYEALGQNEQALAAWQAVKTKLGGADSRLRPRADAAIKRLTKASKPAKA